MFLFSTNLCYIFLALILDKGRGQSRFEEEMAVKETRTAPRSACSHVFPLSIAVRSCRFAYIIAGAKGAGTIITTHTRDADGRTLGWQQLAS